VTGSILITDYDMGEPDVERGIVNAAGFDLATGTCRSEDDVIAAVAKTGAVGLLVQYAPITRRVLEACPNVRGVVRYGVGLDNVDLAAAAERGVEALNVPHYGSEEVADQAVSLLVSLLRGLPWWSAATRRGEWPARGVLPDPLELRECTLGLFGFGAIARQVALRTHAFGMAVVAHDPYVSSDAFSAAGVRSVEWAELWRASTAVSVHAPLTDDTRGIVNAEALNMMPAGGFLVNTARAGLVDRAALETALQTGRIAGVGLDVWWQEPADPADFLLKHPKVLTTPHVAWLSPGSVDRLRAGAARRLVESLAVAGAGRLGH
jgi:D-3-phosphoglycerate dehydrogenase